MRAIFTNFGTRGDFQPLCALAKQARNRGHAPVFAVPPFAAEIVGQFGFESFDISEDLSGLRDEVNRQWILRQDSYMDSKKCWDLLSPFQPYLASAFQELLKACGGADVLISGPAQPLSRMVHDYSGIPFVSVQFNHFGGSGGPALENAGELLLNPFRRQLGLPEIKHPFTLGANSPQLALYAMSPHLRPPHKDWPSHYHMTGFWFTSEKTEIDPKLKAFVEGGAPPVIVTFGSMPNVENIDLIQFVTSVCKLCDSRVVLQSSASPAKISDCVFVADYVPHHWLFKHAAAVVLHGGAGTSAAVFRAGVPGVFVPHIHDQTYWAQMAYEMGCAAEPLAFSDLSIERLAAAIQATLGSEAIRAQAARLGQKVRQENGIHEAWKRVEDLIDKVGLLG